MEAYSGTTLTVLILISVILSSVAFVAVAFLIIFLLCTKYRRSNTVTPVTNRSVTPSDSYTSRTVSVVSGSSVSSSSSSLVSPIPAKRPVIISPKKSQVQQPLPTQKKRSKSISSLEEYPSDRGKKYQIVITPNNDNHETVIQNENQIHNQRQQRQNPHKPTTNIGFNERHTPYPPDVLARDRVMMTYIQASKENQYRP
ncbi:hypothetical protein I4U23_001969 [Adineta vaga]|nr:hypothetical protein I4U23_001969 [Adineta vaga]